MTVDEWKARSLPLGTRFIELESKAQDSGLTEEEGLEMEAIVLRWRTLFRQFLDSEFGVMTKEER